MYLMRLRVILLLLEWVASWWLWVLLLQVQHCIIEFFIYLLESGGG